MTVMMMTTMMNDDDVVSHGASLLYTPRQRNRNNTILPVPGSCVPMMACFLTVVASRATAANALQLMAVRHS